MTTKTSPKELSVLEQIKIEAMEYKKQFIAWLRITPASTVAEGRAFATTLKRDFLEHTVTIRDMGLAFDAWLEDLGGWDVLKTIVLNCDDDDVAAMINPSSKRPAKTTLEAHLLKLQGSEEWGIERPTDIVETIVARSPKTGLVATIEYTSVSLGFGVRVLRGYDDLGTHERYNGADTLESL